MKIGLCHAQTFPVLIQALFKQLLDFGVPAKTQVIVENLQGIFIFSQCKLLQIIVLNYDFFYYNFCNYCNFFLYVKTFGKFLFRTTFLPIFFSRLGWSVGQGDQNGQGGQSCQNIRWSGWLGWVLRVIRMVNLILVVRGQGSQSGWDG